MMQSDFLSGAPGLYKGIPDKVYHDYRGAVSNSMLRHLLRSPAHLAAYLKEPQAATPAMIFGTAYHMAVLEPDRFSEEALEAPRCMALMKTGNRCGSPAKWLQGSDGFCGRHKPKEGEIVDITEAEGVLLLSEWDYECITRMREVLMNHPSAALLLEGERHEASALWYWPEGDPEADAPVLCKGRIDHWSEQFDTLVDLKTTKDATKDAFQKTVYNYGYYRQAAMYLSGMYELGVELTDFTIIAQEKEPPFACSVYRLDDEAIRYGAMQMQALIRQYAQLRDLPLDEWPGYDEQVQDLSLPRWAFDQIYATLD